ncbi:MAG: hypothetical protein Q4E05_10320 [Pseudoclavibacter sp.]|nr:hypothetical protein [Pseudoclavibacter sp.]
MRWSAIRRELAREVLSGTTRALSMLLVAGCLLAVLLGAELAVTRGVLQDAERFRAAGGSTIVMNLPGGVDAARCERLAAVPGVRAAGALRADAQRPLTASALPGAPLPRFHTTPGLPALLGARGADGGGVVLSRDAARALGVAAGDTVASAEGPVRIAAEYDYPDDGRRPGLGYAVLVPAPAQGAFDECWLDAWPPLEDARSLLLFTANGRSEVPPEFSQLNSTLGLEFDGAAEFAGRASLAAAPLAFLAFALVGGASVRIRRLQLAAARHYGVRPAEQTAMLLLGAGVWIAPPACLGVSAGLLASALTPVEGRELLLVVACRVVLAACGGALAGVVLQAALIRERHLFRYFKDR